MLQRGHQLNEEAIPPLEQPPEFGQITFKGEQSEYTVPYDRIALIGTTLGYVSIIAEPNKIKAIRAILYHKNGHASLGYGDCLPVDPVDSYAHNDRSVSFNQEHKWASYVHKMDYGQVHAVFITRDPSFLVHMTPESVWEQLRSKRFTTPLLEQWLPWITRKLIEHRGLQACRCFRMQSGHLHIRDNGQLEDLVSEGLASGDLILS